MKKISVYISTLLGIGYFPIAPGTAGSAVAAIVFFLMPDVWSVGLQNNLIVLFCLIVLSLISVIFISKAEDELGHDSGNIILDEFLGYFFAVWYLPKNMYIIIGAFFLFRLFDIIKPEPANVLQKLHKGWGVLADDVMAGIYTNICLQIIVRIFPLVVVR